MDESELRALVREAIARHASHDLAPGELGGTTWGGHPSHGLLPLARGGDGDGACLIEPTVRCNHCGYCLSYGH